MSNEPLKLNQKAAILRMTGLIVAAFFMFWLKSKEATLPQEGVMGRTFCQVMVGIGLVTFLIGSVLRIMSVRKENQ
jgi:hypothetical protein